MRRFLTTLSLTAPLALANALPVFAQAPAVYTIQSTAAGYYRSDGFYNLSPQYVVGDIFTNGAPTEYRDFFYFNVPILDFIPDSVVLEVRNGKKVLDDGTPSPTSGYISPDASETFSIFDITSSSRNLAGSNPVVGTPYASGNATGQGIFNDLGSGINYGNKNVTLADDGQLIQIFFNSAGIADLVSAINTNRAAGGDALLGVNFGIGGALTSIDRNVTGSAGNEYFFGGVGATFTRRLVITGGTAPEPGTFALLACGLAAGAFAIRRRRRAL